MNKFKIGDTLIVAKSCFSIFDEGHILKQGERYNVSFVEKSSDGREQLQLSRMFGSLIYGIFDSSNFLMDMPNFEIGELVRPTSEEFNPNTFNQIFCNKFYKVEHISANAEYSVSLSEYPSGKMINGKWKGSHLKRLSKFDEDELSNRSRYNAIDGTGVGRIRMEVPRPDTNKIILLLQ
jgi:hypothetical protein